MSGILLASVGNSYGSLPVNLVAPVVSGDATSGSTLTTTDGTWEGAPAPTFSYQWQRSGSNISGATSSSYVVVEADIGSTIRCVVTATNSLGSVSANSNQTATVVRAIGSSYQGGFYGGQINDGGTIYNLVVSPKSSGQSTDTKYKTTNDFTSLTQSLIDGPSNTFNAVAAAGTHPAAEFCDGLSIGGYSDWYLPSQNELDVLYFNLKPTTDSNTTSGGIPDPQDGSSGINPNSIPERTEEYTPSNPQQTSVSAFQEGGSEAFGGIDGAAMTHWTSTTPQSAYTEAHAMYQSFSNGFQGTQNKNFNNTARAIRRVQVV